MAVTLKALQEVTCVLPREDPPPGALEAWSDQGPGSAFPPNVLSSQWTGAVGAPFRKIHPAAGTKSRKIDCELYQGLRFIHLFIRCVLSTTEWQPVVGPGDPVLKTEKVLRRL